MNAVLRLGILAMTVDTLVHASDERFAGKGLQARDVLISFGFAMVFPLFWKLRYARRQWHRYPWWFDDLYLSIYALDMLGNELGLYDTSWWSNIPHGYGPGALAIVLTGAFGLTLLEALGLSTIFHTWLQIEEMYGDILGGTHNFRDQQYEWNQMLYGLLGTFAAGAIWYFAGDLRRKRAKKLHRPRR